MRGFFSLGLFLPAAAVASFFVVVCLFVCLVRSSFDFNLCFASDIFFFFSSSSSSMYIYIHIYFVLLCL